MAESQFAWIVYESVHGNTRAIAEAVAEGLRATHPVRLAKADEVGVARLRQARLVVLGCPTHGFSLSPAMKAFAGTLARGDLEDVPVAAFDTRFAIADMPSRVLKVIVPIVGKRAWAATHLARVARRAGGKQAAEPEGFVVRGVEGPLADGEVERATAWGRELGRKGTPPDAAATAERSRPMRSS